ncbi:transcriptional regulator [Lachnospiraceae bacterium MD329]|nr:transcriptional regulator [Lachnospiraceae bacterium MD329]
MATTNEYADYVMSLLSQLEDIMLRKMMGEYLLYYKGKLFGGIYNNRFLVKITPHSSSVLDREEIPYEGAKPMLMVESEDMEFVSGLVEGMYDELPEPKPKKKKS